MPCVTATCSSASWGRAAWRRSTSRTTFATTAQVAVKVLRPDLAATLGADRFLQEIETAARFQHPHILPLPDSGEASGFLYYVMPYIDGESLRARARHRPP
jgi:serine/threonine protein kinase